MEKQWKIWSSDPVKSSFLDCILFAVNKDDYFEKFNIREIRQMYKTSSTQDYKEVCSESTDQPDRATMVAGSDYELV